ncbi:LysR family transcriptional regulator [Notoacmeibacter ruber]|uniref:LysR family transcriptional regulator n=1 Tax=Notoacmeibacter ruber TaxID=2670375 RepID=A0A3L7JC68_9HYPH|nr:LysR family transcriptional regulator [Notoacmeibacter ruber]RLQ88243.1 LysR family transcriptional regulator [Notoacmeibacter ruber]
MAYLDNVRTFVRIYELGSMSAAARDLHISPAVASARISQLEQHLDVRLFQRTTRSLSPTEQGRIFYDGATRIIGAVEEAEAGVSAVTGAPAGTLSVATPLGLGRRFIAPAMGEFRKAYPRISVRLRLSDRSIDLANEGLDIAFFLGRPKDSNLRIRQIAQCQRVLVASPAYLSERGHPTHGEAIAEGRHDCLNLRFPGAAEYRWTLQTDDGEQAFSVRGPLECDDGDVLTDWALAGLGIAMKPLFEVAHHLETGALVRVCEQTPPVPAQLACLYIHRKHQDPKTRLFMDFMIDSILDQARDGGLAF